MVPPDSGGVSRAPPYLGYPWVRSGFRLRGSHPLRRRFPAASPSLSGTVSESRNPGEQAPRFGLPRFRSPLLTRSRLMSLPQGTEMFHFPWCRLGGLWIHPPMTALADGRVAPFGNPRIKALWRLPEACRSLMRPSSPPDAKASVVRPYTLSKKSCLDPLDLVIRVVILFNLQLPVVKEQSSLKSMLEKTVDICWRFSPSPP